MRDRSRLPLSAQPDFIALPVDPKQVTPEQRATAFPGLDNTCLMLAKAFFAHAARQHAHPTTTQEAADARHEPPDSAAVRPAVRAAAGAGERGTMGQKAARRRAKSA